MRRILLVAIAGLFTLPVAACADNAGEPSSASTTPAATSGASNTEEVCQEIEAVFDESTFEPLGTSIGELIAFRQQGNSAEAAQAETEIKDQITAISDRFSAAAEKADDPELKQKLTTAAAQVSQATDLKFLENVQKPEDVQGPLTTLLTGWVTPIASVCETN